MNEELARLRSLSELWAKELNRRAVVEQTLWDIANGKRDVPTREECREWAVKLGVAPELMDAARNKT